MRLSGYSVSSGMRGFGETMVQVGQGFEQLKLEEMSKERTAQRNREMALADAEQARWYGAMKTLIPELVRKNDPRITDFDKFYEDEWKIGEKNITAHTHLNQAKKDKTNELIVQKELCKNNLRELWEKTNVDQEGMNFFANYKDDMTSSASYINEPDLIEHIVSIDVPAKEIQEDGRIEELSTPEQLRLIWRNNRTKKFSDYCLQRPDKVVKNEDGTKTVLKDYYIEHPNELVDKYMMRVEDNRELFGPEETADLKKRYEAKIKESNSIIKQEYDVAVNKGVKAIQEKLYLKRDFTNARDFIDQNLPPEAVNEREHWYDKADRLAEAELSKEQNPFDKTMNPAKRQELLEKAARDQIIHDEIDEWVGKPDGISIDDGQQIHKVLDDPAHIYRSPWAETIKQGIDAAYDLQEKTLGGDVKKIPELQKWKAQKYNEMNQFIKNHEEAGTTPTPQQIEGFLNSTFKETGSNFLSDIWKGIKLGIFLPPVGAARLISKKRELDRAKSKSISNLDMTKRFPGETVAEYKLRKSVGPLDEVVKNE